jgi:Tol biopolymer transport system component
VVDRETFMHLGYSESDIIDYTALSYPYGALSVASEGAPFTRLLKGSGEEVYWMENGFRRHIPDMDTFRQLGYRTEDIFPVPDNVLRGWPLGEPLPSVLGASPESIPAPSQERVVLSYRPLDRHVRASELFTVYADGRNPRRLSYTTGYTYHTAAAWSSDGRSIAFTQCLADMPTSSGCDVAITRSDRWEPQWLAKAVLMHRPVWSPDGTRLAFSQGSLGASIAVMNIDGSNVRPTAVESGHYAWTPDGRIAFWTLEREAPEKSSLMIMDADGQNIRPVETQVTVFDQRYSPWRQCKWVAGEPPQQ